MSAEKLLDKVLSILRDMKDDKEKLEKLLSFMEDEFLSEEDEDEDVDYKEQLPEKYREVVRLIANGLSANYICFYNPDTLEVEDIPKSMYEELDFDAEWDDDELDLSFLKWENGIKIEPLDSRESFDIMDRFVNQLKNKKEAYKLTQALNGHKPFANFNHIIHNSDCRDEWFAFRQRQLERYVIQDYFYKYLEDYNKKWNNNYQKRAQKRKY
ncbi:MAG: UPF0158 family protein [Prevotellaceae bacterium]|jgi:hypothetical protein|nr:UPF0158 family protein [Prevotellaceae bacterium]